MKIGVIATGNMGRSIGILLAQAGHTVLFGARNQAAAEAAAQLAGNGSTAGSNDDAARFGDVLVWGVRGVNASEVLTDIASVTGKPIIDMNNSGTRIDGGIGPKGESSGERLQRELPEAKIVKAFNTLAMEVFEVDFAARKAVSVFLASDHADAKATVRGLVEQFGFTPVDFGALRMSPMLEGIADVVRAVIQNGGSPFSSISVVPLPKPETFRLGGRAPSRLK